MHKKRCDVKYSLCHLTQGEDQNVIGPVQDDEALFLFALCRVMMVKNVVEIGVQSGYSAQNFLKAVGSEGSVIGIDTNKTAFCSDRFTFINSCAGAVSPEQIPWNIDLLFFDSHSEYAQKKFFENMKTAGKITDETIIALHDTGLHPVGVGIGTKLGDGYAHQPVERMLSNWLVSFGYSPFHAHTNIAKHNNKLPFRHGLTILCKQKILEV